MKHSWFFVLRRQDWPLDWVQRVAFLIWAKQWAEPFDRFPHKPKT
jgi:hypothetical protein